MALRIQTPILSVASSKYGCLMLSMENPNSFLSNMPLSLGDSLSSKYRAKYLSFNVQQNIGSPIVGRSNVGSGAREEILCALPEAAASIAVAATIVGAAATFLTRRNKSSDIDEVPTKICEDCGGSGVCSECNGEGFVLKRLSEENAEKARLMAKNMATRYTAGLPKKWSYCTKCSSTRSCSICGGSGKLSYLD